MRPVGATTMLLEAQDAGDAVHLRV